MPAKGDQKPTLQEEVLYRPRDILEVFRKLKIDDTVPRLSNAVACAPFRKFGIFVGIDSTSTPDLLHVEIEFLDWWTGQWYTYKQGPFAALFWEDGDTASGIWECFVGDVLGRELRVKLTGVNVDQSDNVLSSTKYFTVTIGIDLWN